jgi:hypothetical protein
LGNQGRICAVVAVGNCGWREGREALNDEVCDAKVGLCLDGELADLLKGMKSPCVQKQADVGEAQAVEGLDEATCGVWGARGGMAGSARRLSA